MSEELAMKMNIMRKERSFTDVILVWQTQEHPAHRFALSICSPYFSDKFKNPESPMDRIELNEIKGDQTVGILLEFIYISKLDPKLDIDSVKNLLHAAHFLKIQKLINKCTEVLVQQLTIENCLDFWLSSSFYCYDWLDFVSTNFNQLTNPAVETFLAFSIDEMKRFMEIVAVKLNSEMSFKAIDNWVKHAPLERSTYLFELLKLIDLKNLTKTSLNDIFKIAVAKGEMDLIRVVRETASSRLPRRRSAKYSNPIADLQLHCITKDCIRSFSFAHEIRITKRGPSLTDGILKELKNNIISSCGQFLYFINIATKTVIQYHPVLSQWSNVADLLAPVQINALTTACDGKLYVSDDNSLQQFDPSKNCWKLLTPLRHYLRSLVCVGKQLYAVSENTRYIHSYDPTADEWRELLEVTMKFDRCLVVSGYIYFHSDNVDEAQMYDPDKNCWFPSAAKGLEKYRLLSFTQDLPFLLLIEKKGILYASTLVCKSPKKIFDGFQPEGNYFITL